MPQTLDLSNVIKSSTCDVTLDSLNKRGVRQVKVVNREMISRLISKTVDSVLAQRTEKVTSAEREKVMRQAREQIDEMAKKTREKAQGRIAELEGEVESLNNRLRSGADEADVTRLHQENERLSGEVERLQGEVNRLAELGSGGAGMDPDAVSQLLDLVGEQIQKTVATAKTDGDVMGALSALTNKVEKIRFSATGGAAGIEAPDEATIDFLTGGDDAVETNLTAVGVKQKKAGDVKGALDKLKQLQKGED